MRKQTKRRSGVQIMSQLIGLVKPMLPIMLAAIFLGTLGYLCAIFLTITAAGAVVTITDGSGISGSLFFLLIALAVLRGILHYAEQYCNAHESDQAAEPGE